MRNTPCVEGWCGSMATSRSSPSPAESAFGNNSKFFARGCSAVALMRQRLIPIHSIRLSATHLCELQQNSCSTRIANLSCRKLLEPHAKIGPKYNSLGSFGSGQTTFRSDLGGSFGERPEIFRGTDVNGFIHERERGGDAFLEFRSPQHLWFVA